MLLAWQPSAQFESESDIQQLLSDFKSLTKQLIYLFNEAAAFLNSEGTPVDGNVIREVWAPVLQGVTGSGSSLRLALAKAGSEDALPNFFASCEALVNLYQ